MPLISRKLHNLKCIDWSFSIIKHDEFVVHRPGKSPEKICIEEVEHFD